MSQNLIYELLAKSDLKVAQCTIASVRYLEQSQVTAVDVVDDQGQPHPLLYKLMDVEELRKRVSKSDEKWEISRKSFLNEVTFYSLLRAMYPRVPLGVPQVYAVEEPRAILMSRFDRHVQQDVLDLKHAKAALAFLAQFHAYFWQEGSSELGSCEACPPTSGLLPHGGWWRRELRPSVRYDTIPACWERLWNEFDLSGRVSDESLETSRELMRRLSLPASMQRLEQLSRSNRHTVIHGDFKSSNIMFSAGGEACAIDFQWTGRSSPAADLVYFLWSAVDPMTLAAHEHELLAEYHSLLIGRRPSLTNSYSLDAFSREYDVEFAEYWKTVLPQLTPGLGVHTMAANRIFGNLTFEFDVDALQLICSKAVEVLRRLDGSGLF
jgi:tRNA A-37 threonylcarbamoyl transferase component Bud32